METGERVQDPVCGKWIYKRDAYSKAEYKNQTFYLCCPMCRAAFQMRPEEFVRRIDGEWRRDEEEM